MFCPNCGSEYKEGQNFCINCGAKLIKEEQQIVDVQTSVENDVTIDVQEEITEEPEITETPEIDEEGFEEEDNKVSIGKIVGYFAIGFIVVFLILSFFGKTVDVGIPNETSQEEIGELPGDDIEQLPQAEEIKSLGCDSTNVKNMVLNLFKQKDYYFKYLDPASIATVDLINSVEEDYIQDIDKHVCRATVVMKAKNGFMPKAYDSSNPFYSLVQTYHETDEGIPTIKKVKQLDCSIEYTSELIDGSNKVQTTACDRNESPSIMTWDSKDEYLEIPGERQKYEKAKKAEAQRLEQERQAEERARQEAIKKQEQYNNSSEGIRDNVEQDLF